MCISGLKLMVIFLSGVFPGAPRGVLPVLAGSAMPRWFSLWWVFPPESTGTQRQLCWPCLDSDLAWNWLFSIQMIFWECREVCCESLKAVSLVSVVRQWEWQLSDCAAPLVLDYLGFLF